MEYFKCEIGKIGDECRLKNSPNGATGIKLKDITHFENKVEAGMEIYHKNLFMISLDGFRS